MATFTPDLSEWNQDQLEALAEWLDGYMIPGIIEDEWDEIWATTNIYLPTPSDSPEEDWLIPGNAIAHFTVHGDGLSFLVFTWDGKLTDTEGFMHVEALRNCDAHGPSESWSYQYDQDGTCIEHYRCGCNVIRPDSVILTWGIGV